VKSLVRYQKLLNKVKSLVRYQKILNQVKSLIRHKKILNQLKSLVRYQKILNQVKSLVRYQKIIFFAGERNGDLLDEENPNNDRSGLGRRCRFKLYFLQVKEMEIYQMKKMPTTIGPV